MPAYVIVETDVIDPEQYERYKAASPAAIAAGGGRFLVLTGPRISKPEPGLTIADICDSLRDRRAPDLRLTNPRSRRVPVSCGHGYSTWQWRKARDWKSCYERSGPLHS